MSAVIRDMGFNFDYHHPYQSIDDNFGFLIEKKGFTNDCFQSIIPAVRFLLIYILIV